MRIGIDVHKALPPRDGVGNFNYHLTAALLAADPAVEYTLYAPRSLDASRFAELFAAPDGTPSARYRVVRHWPPAPGELDLFHSMTWRVPPQPLAGTRAAASPTPLLFTCYDLTVLTHPEHHVFGNKVATATATIEAACGGARFLAISQATADELSAVLEVPANEVTVVYPGIPPRFSAPADAAERESGRQEARRRVAERWGFGGPPVVSVGTLEPRKNLLRLLEAWERLPDELTRRHPLLLVGGSGWLSDELERRLQARHGDVDLSAVHVLGYVTDDELVDLYRAAAAFVYPSLAEGFGLPVAEALACGAPTATSRVTSLPEAGGDAALYFDPHDVGSIARALERLLSEPELAAELSRRGPLHAARFTWERAARETLAIYRRILDGPIPENAG